MRIFVLTLGSRGDFEQFLTIGRELHRRGHQLLIGTSEFYGPRVAESGIEWAPIGSGTQEELVEALQECRPVSDLTERTHLFFRRWLQPQLKQGLARIKTLALETDYIVNNLKMILQRRGAAIPGAVVTYDPPGALKDLARYGTDRHGDAIIDLVAMNKALIDPQGLWPERYRFTGFWKGESPRSYRPPRALHEFLEAGEPPVVVAMGTSGSAMFDAERLAAAVVEALHESRRRCLVVGGWSGVSMAGLGDERVRFVESIPYEWLFPRASCVIHHGGVGTLAMVLRAGKPSIVLPQITAQDHFGRILDRERLATGVFGLHDLSGEQLAAAIDRATEDAEVRAATERWRQAIAEERGTTRAADLIEQHWDRLEA